MKELKTHLDTMERIIPMSIHQAITAAQETPAEAILTLVHPTDRLAGCTKFLVQRVTKAVVPQQLIQAALSKNEPFLEFCLVLSLGLIQIYQSKNTY